MKRSQMCVSTLKETPKEAVIKSHVLMLRAGLIFKQSSGIYGYLPLGLRVFQKVHEIVREEISRIGAQQIALPLIVPQALWEKSGRYQKMKKGMFTFQDRHAQNLLLGPTHEESVVEMLSGFLTSYKQLPLNVFQIEKKFRDEIRPRYGVMRGREFTMMDGYSFHQSLEDLDRVYQLYRLAYRRIFVRIGLSTVAVQADSGDMGGSGSEEFMVPNSIGDDMIFSCSQCSYVANRELATFFMPEETFPALPKGPIATKDVKNISALSEFLKISPSQTVKTVVFQTKDKRWVLAMVRGDREINELKLSHLVGEEVFYAENTSEIENEIGPVGFLGPEGLSIQEHWIVVVDNLLLGDQPKVVGMNLKDFHYQGFLFSDFTPNLTGDITNAEDGDFCPVCHEGTLKLFTGIEVGHIFQLGDDYTRAMGFFVTDDQGGSLYPMMGCYGIGVDRSIAAVIEQEGDNERLILPSSISPFQVLLISIGKENVLEAEQLTQELEKNWEVLWDDRDVSAGIKFKDSDLSGIPIRITLGKKFREEKMCGMTHQRFSKEEEFFSLQDVPGRIEEWLKKEEQIRQEQLEKLPKIL